MYGVMAVGFAGGIGLSGGVCGALGAAIWNTEMSSLKEGVSDKVTNSRAGDMIDRFIKSAANRKIKCFEIGGWRFENIGDHVGCLRDGGCSEIIEVLATKCL